jgi:hypothetical protein
MLGFKEKEVIAAAKPDLKIVRYFLAAGFLVPCLLYLVLADTGFEAWILLPWPTSVLLMSAEAGGSGAEAIAFLISPSTRPAECGFYLG